MSNLTFKSRLLVLLGVITMCVTQVWAEDATMAAGTNGSTATVNSKSAIKVGTSKAGGDMTITVPAGATSLEFYAAAWKGVSGLSLNITSTANVSPTSVSLTADDGIANNSPFTLSGTESSYKFTIALSNITSETTLTLTGSTTKRFVVWGATYSSGGGSNPTITKSGTLTAFTATYGSASAEQTFTVGGSKLTANITVSAPTNYEISETSGSGFGSSVTLTKDGSGNVANTTLYIRLKNNIDAGSVAAASISCTSTGATEQTISIPASKVQSKVNWSVNGSAAAGSPTLAVDKAGKVTTLPTAPTSSDGDGSKVFVGWTDATIASPTNTKPTTLFTAASGAPAVNANEVTYYAVFADAGAGGVANLTKLGSGDTFSDGDKIVIVANTDNGKLMYQETVSTSYVAYKQVGSDVGQVELTAAGIAADDKNWFTLTAGTGANAGKWRLGDATNGYINVSSNNLYCNATATYFSITWNSTNNGFTIKDGSRWIRCRADLTGDNQYKWRGAGNSGSPTTGSVCYLDIYRYSAGGASYSNYATTCGPAGSCATPTFSQEGGSYCGTQSVTISCTTDGASIYYTTDGTTPTSSSTLYSSAISVSADMTIKAIAVKDGLIDSEVATAAYSITDLRDTFIDNLHENARQYGDCDNYTVPSLSDETPASACEGEHYHFVGWSSAQLYTGQHATEPAGLLKAGSHHNADGSTYYAVWAKEQH